MTMSYNWNRFKNEINCRKIQPKTLHFSTNCSTPTQEFNLNPNINPYLFKKQTFHNNHSNPRKDEIK